MNPADLKLGRKRGVVKDPRTLKLAAFLPAKLPKPPERFQVGKGTNYAMYANDEIGDCGLASMGHRIQAQQRAAGQHEIGMRTADVVAAYEIVGGYRPGHPETDNGVYGLDVLNFMRKIGMGRERDGTTHKISAFVEVNPWEQGQVDLALYLADGLYVGWDLPLSAQDQLGRGEHWTKATGSRARPGSWGGHLTFMDAFSRDNYALATWSERQVLSREFFEEYATEVYAIISEDQLRATGKTNLGFDLAGLKHEVAQIEDSG